MDQGEEQECKALEERHMGGELGPLPDHLESTYLQDMLEVSSRGGDEQFGDSSGSQIGCLEAEQGGCEEEEEVKLPCFCWRGESSMDHRKLDGVGKT